MHPKFGYVDWIGQKIRRQGRKGSNSQGIGSGSWVAQVPVEVAPSSRVATIESMSASRDVTTRTGVEQEASDADASV